MSKQPHRFHNGKSGTALTIRVVSRQTDNCVLEFLDDGVVKIGLKPRPDDTYGNHALTLFLSEILGTTPSNVEVVAGFEGQDKLVTVLQMDPETVQTRLKSKLG